MTKNEEIQLELFSQTHSSDHDDTCKNIPEALTTSFSQKLIVENIKEEEEENCFTKIQHPPISMVTVDDDNTSTAEESASSSEDEDSSSSSSSGSSSSSSSSLSIFSDSDSSYTMLSSESIIANNNSFHNEKQIKFLLRYLKKSKKKRKGDKYIEMLNSLSDVIDKEKEKAINFDDDNEKEKFSCDEKEVVSTEEIKYQQLDSYECSSSLTEQNSSRLNAMLQYARFEIKYFLPTALALAAYSVTHISLWEILTNMLLEPTRNLEIPPNAFNIGLVLVGFAISRLTGAAWYWLNDDLYEGARIEMRQRKEKGLLDTKIQLWFKKHRLLRSAMGMLSFYLTHIGMVYFVSYVLFPTVSDSKEYFLDNLPSKVNHNRSTIVTDLIAMAVDGDYTNSEYNPNSCNYASSDYEFLFSKLTSTSDFSFFGSYDSNFVTLTQTILFYASVAFCSIGILIKLKVGLD